MSYKMSTTVLPQVGEFASEAISLNEVANKSQRKTLGAEIPEIEMWAQMINVHAFYFNSMGSLLFGR